MSNSHSFVICAYGESPFLEACMASLKAQTYDSDIMLYTSTPNDHIQALATRYQIPVHTAQGGGIGKDWNNALSIVKTPYVTLAHQDDVYLPDYAEQVMAEFTKYPTSSIVFTDYQELRDGELILSNLNLKIKRLMLSALRLAPSSAFWQQRVLSLGNPISCPAVSYNLATLADFRFNETWRTSLDWLAWYTISKEYDGRFSYINQPLMLHRIHPESETTQTIADNSRTKEDLQMFEYLWPKPLANLLIKLYAKSQKSND